MTASLLGFTKFHPEFIMVQNETNGSLQIILLSIGAGRILKVEGHSGGSNYFGAKRRKTIIFGAPHFSDVPTQFLMELGAQPSKLNNSNCHF